MDTFEKNPSGGYLTKGMEMVGVMVKAVPGGNASLPSSVIHTKRFLRECGWLDLSLSMLSEFTRDNTKSSKPNVHSQFDSIFELFVDYVYIFLWKKVLVIEKKVFKHIDKTSTNWFNGQFVSS